mgnify:CR=1 FL=1
MEPIVPANTINGLTYFGTANTPTANSEYRYVFTLLTNATSHGYAGGGKDIGETKYTGNTFVDLTFVNVSAQFTSGEILKDSEDATANVKSYANTTTVDVSLEFVNGTFVVGESATIATTNVTINTITTSSNTEVTIGANSFITGSNTSYDLGFDTSNTVTLGDQSIVRVDSIVTVSYANGHGITAGDRVVVLGANTGYEEFESKTSLIKYKQSEDHYEIILDKTPFYAESGGQIGDMGTLSAGKFSFKVEDVQKFGDEFIHIGVVESGSIQDIQKVDASINENSRKQIRRNHTATHLLHQALKEILGEHVQQAGSLVAAESLRFDLTHYEQISDSQIEEIEKRVNSIILQNKVVETEIKNYQEARKEGAVSLFGEKYGEVVRVVNVPGISKELCGGTHVNRTGDIGGIKIISESALAAGVRRLVAISGDAIPSLLNKQQHTISNICSELKCSEEEIPGRLQSLIADRKNLEKEIRGFKQSSMTNRVDELVADAEKLGDLRLVVHKVDDPGDLKELGDQFRQAFKSQGVSLIGTIQREKPMVMCAVTDDLTSQIQAGKVVKEVGGIMGGGGGGKPHIATAGGSDINLLQDALDHGKKMIQTILTNS